MAFYYAVSFVTMLLIFLISEEISGQNYIKNRRLSKHSHLISEPDRKGDAFYKRKKSQVLKPQTSFSVEANNTHSSKESSAPSWTEYNGDNNTISNTDGTLQIVFPLTILIEIKQDPLEYSAPKSDNNGDVPKSRSMTAYDNLPDSTQNEFGPRILGGEKESIVTVPYLVSILRNLSHYCGGTIITNIHVVTAAHCTEGVKVTDLKIRAGSSYTDRDGVLIDVAQIFDHPWYNNETLHWDVSVLKLAKPLDFDDQIQPVRLPEEFDTWEPGTRGLVSGWGSTEEDASFDTPIDLMATVLYLEDMNDCRLGLEIYDVNLTDAMLCASHEPENADDTCQGDSGGGLVVEGILAGIVAWDIGCARPGVPGILTNVPKVVGFIKQVTMSYLKV